MRVIKVTGNSTFKMRFMASGPITSWHKDGETVETMRNFIGGWGSSKISEDGYSVHEIKIWFLLRRKVITRLDSIL